MTGKTCKLVMWADEKTVNYGVVVVLSLSEKPRLYC
jgi:hypothetical protein